MPGKLRNIIEDIARDFLNSSLTLRYDICTCAQCKNDMLAYVLSHVPAKYVTTESGAMHTIMQETRVETQAVIARAILQAVDLVSKSPRHELKENKTKIFELLLDKIKENRGLDLHHYHQDLLRRRVAVRLRSLGVASYSEYLRLLLNKPEEYDKLFEVLCINVSEFFRDPEVWALERKLFEKVVREKRGSGTDKNIRVWSAGCANGEEAHTIAILLRETLGGWSPEFNVEISATDIDKVSLNAAMLGRYEKSVLRNVEKKLLERYFSAGPDGTYQANEDIRRMITLRYLDLTTSDTLNDFDFVFCRNVFIYFDHNLQEQLLMKFYKALKPGGYLTMGKSETLIREAKTIFEPVDVEARIYRKI